MRSTVLLTGFGPFPGVPFNPTEPLVTQLAYQRHFSFAGVRRVAHVFRTAYDAVDRELPALLAQEEPDVVVMFGLAQRSRHIRIETQAHNAITQIVADAGGQRPLSAVIAPESPALLPLRAPARRLVRAVTSAGMPAAPSHDAGRYVCNYLCWRVAEAAAMTPRLRIVTFVHVPRIERGPGRSRSRRPPFFFDDLMRAGQAIVLAALTAARR